MAKRSITEQAGRIDPVISMGTRAYDLVSRYWPQLFALFVAGGGMSALSYLTSTVRALGPAGIGGIGLVSGLTAWLVITLVQYLRAKRHKLYAESSAITKWKETVDTINPLDTEFRRMRIKLSDLRHPITGLIMNKRFIDCEFFGPANVMLISGNFNDGGFHNCDVVIARERVMIHNTVGFVNSEVYKCHFWNCTMFIPATMRENFKSMGAHFISYTLDEEIDSSIDELPKGYVDPTNLRHG